MPDSNPRLEELQQQLQDLLAKQQELVQANKKYEEVFSLITHEFKNLLTSADGYNRLLRQRLLAENRSDLDDILTAGIRIHQKLFIMVDQLLKMWMIEKQILKPDYKLLDFNLDILQPVEQQLHEALQAKQMILNKNLPAGKLILMADGNLLEIVMRNLLDNAIKYGVPASRINLALSKEDQEMAVALRNKVNKLPEDFCATIFQPGQQLRWRAQSGGLGIGLYNVKNLIALHQGEIFCRQVKQDWIEFRFTLPLHLENSPTAG
jgi:signal transduction histidine kinase